MFASSPPNLKSLAFELKAKTFARKAILVHLKKLFFKGDLEVSQDCNSCFPLYKQKFPSRYKLDILVDSEITDNL